MAKQQKSTEIQRKRKCAINWNTIKLAYITRKDIASLRGLSKEFGVHLSHIATKSKEGEWVEQRKQYWDVISTKILQECSEEEAQRLIKSRQRVRTAIEKLEGQIEKGEAKASYDALDKLTRLEEFLHGNADSRTEGGFNYELFLKEVMTLRVRQHKEAIAGQQKQKQLPVIDVKKED